MTPSILTVAGTAASGWFGGSALRPFQRSCVVGLASLSFVMCAGVDRTVVPIVERISSAGGSGSPSARRTAWSVGSASPIIESSFADSLSPLSTFRDQAGPVGRWPWE